MQFLQDRLKSLEDELRLLEKNLGRAEDDNDFKVLSRQCREKRVEVESTRQKVEQNQLKQPVQNDEPEAEAEQAMRLFDQIKLLAKDAAARAAIPAMLKRMNLNLWFRFTEEMRGKRALRRLAGGVITSGNDPLPVRPYGGTNDDDDGGRPNPGGAGTGTLPAPSDEMQTSSASVSQQEDVSLSKVHRLEETQIERFIAGTMTLNMALVKHLTRTILPVSGAAAPAR